jgi:hypothetical protein
VQSPGRWDEPHRMTDGETERSMGGNSTTGMRGKEEPEEP